MAVWCTKTSAPPSGCEMKPKPFSALNHLTVPEATVAFPFPPHVRCRQPPPTRRASALPTGADFGPAFPEEGSLRQTLAVPHGESTAQGACGGLFTRRSPTSYPGPLGSVFHQPTAGLQLATQSVRLVPLAGRAGLVPTPHQVRGFCIHLVPGPGPEVQTQHGAEQCRGPGAAHGGHGLTSVVGPVGGANQIEH